MAVVVIALHKADTLQNAPTSPFGTHRQESVYEMRLHRRQRLPLHENRERLIFFRGNQITKPGLLRQLGRRLGRQMNLFRGN